MFVLFVAVSLLTWLSYKSKHALKNSILPYEIACFGNTCDLVKSASLAFFCKCQETLLLCTFKFVY